MVRIRIFDASAQLGIEGALDEVNCDHVVAAPNGKCYAAPYEACRVLEVCPSTRAVRQIGPRLQEANATNGRYVALFSCMCVADNGKLYAPPFDHQRILELDPETASINFIGPVLTGNGKYASITTASNGKLYAAPYLADKVLEIDPAAGTARFIGPVIPGPADSGKFESITVAANGRLYAAPYAAPVVLEINPARSTVRLLQSPLFKGPSAHQNFSDICAAHNGQLYAVPAEARGVLEINPANDKMRFIGEDVQHRCLSSAADDYLGRMLFLRGSMAMGSNGKIYAVPYQARNVLEIDPATSTVTALQPSLSGFSGLAPAASGLLYGTPDFAERVLEIDPATPSLRMLGPTVDPPSERMFYCCRAATNGHLSVMIPQNAKKVLTIDVAALPSMVDHLSSLRLADQFTDVDIVVCGTTFRTHRVVLARIPFFKPLLRGEECGIQMQDASPDAFKVVLQAAYEDDYKLLDVPDMECLRGVLKLSHRLEFWCLRDWASERLADLVAPNMTAKDLHAWTLFAQRYEARSLEQAFKSLTVQNILAQTSPDEYGSVSSSASSKRRRFAEVPIEIYE